METTIWRRIDRDTTLIEEIFNAITHGLGAAFSIAGLTLMVVFASLFGDVWRIVSVSIYGGSLVLLYLSSTLYHSILQPKVKAIFLKLDHVGIFLLIAGTYTPFLLVSLRDTIGIQFMYLIWGIAIVGVLTKIFLPHRWSILTTIAYVAMGWLSIFLISDAIVVLGPAGFKWLLAGGIFYTAGVAFFLWNRLLFNHAIWHLFVVAGSVCHFVAVFKYVLPM